MATDREVKEAVRAYLDACDRGAVDQEGMRAALDAAASVRAEGERDPYAGQTLDGEPFNDTDAPTAGPIPPAGAPVICYWVCSRCRTQYSSKDSPVEWLCPQCGHSANPDNPSPQPPAPAEGGTDVAGIARDLLHAHKAWMTGGYPEGAGILFLKAADALTTQAAALAAKEAEIETRRDEVQHQDRVIAVWGARIAALEAALRDIRAHTYSSDGYCALNSDSVAAISEIARAALSGKEPQQS